jgi:hypothetical protein
MAGTQSEAEPRLWLWPFSRRQLRGFVWRLAQLLPLPPLPSDDRVDAWLDRLRDGDGARLVLPAPARAAACWVAAASVLAYYGARYAAAAAALALPRCAGGGGAKSRRRRVPLMLEARTKKAAPPGGDPQDRDRDIYDELREELARSGLIVAEDGTSPPSVAGREDDRRRRRRWVDAIRGDASLRRWVSRFLQLDDETARRIDAPLWDLLDSIYPDLLPLPSSRRGGTRGPGSGRGGGERRRHVYEVSAVVPFHDGEPPGAVRRTLRELFARCRDPRRAQLVLVRATVADDSKADDAAARDGDGDEKRRWRADDVVASLVDPGHRAGWGDVTLVAHIGGGGRGPALNAGAAACGGRVVAFVHADCLVPDGWDLSIRSALPDDDEEEEEGKEGRRSPRVVATAFRLGIDCSETSPWPESLFGFRWARSGAPDAERSAGLEGAEDRRRRCPRGIRAVEVMVNLRSSWLGMPYGDQALAMRLDDFWYVGGFPQQPIMEDYEFVSHLRLRASCPALEGRGGECLRVLPDACRCSPRRWQSHGVLYVTLANAVLVHRYTRHEDDPRRWDPDRVFEYYYRRRPPPSTQRDDKAG